MPYVVVFDTNILVSAVGWRGKPHRCLEPAGAGVVEGVTCQELLDELTEKLYAKLNFSHDQVIDTLADLLSFLRLVTIANTLKVVATDPDDDKVLECAVVGGATHIITGDRRHLLPLGNYQGIAIVTASDFLAQMAAP
jgi:putative PIN family toxin of toxin-antitoxin system